MLSCYSVLFLRGSLLFALSNAYLYRLPARERESVKLHARYVPPRITVGRDFVHVFGKLIAREGANLNKTFLSLVSLLKTLSTVCIDKRTIEKF